jgi:hypothetical protein
MGAVESGMSISTPAQAAREMTISATIAQLHRISRLPMRRSPHSRSFHMGAGSLVDGAVYFAATNTAGV